MGCVGSYLAAHVCVTVAVALLYLDVYLPTITTMLSFFIMYVQPQVKTLQHCTRLAAEAMDDEDNGGALMETWLVMVCAGQRREDCTCFPHVGCNTQS